MSFKTSIFTGLFSAFFLSFIPSAPILAEWLNETGPGMYGGSQYNAGEYQDAHPLDQSIYGHSIEDSDGNLYDQNIYGIYERRD